MCEGSLSANNNAILLTRRLDSLGSAGADCNSTSFKLTFSRCHLVAFVRGVLKRTGKKKANEAFYTLHQPKNAPKAIQLHLICCALSITWIFNIFTNHKFKPAAARQIKAIYTNRSDKLSFFLALCWLSHAAVFIQHDSHRHSLFLSGLHRTKAVSGLLYAPFLVFSSFTCYPHSQSIPFYGNGRG